MMASASSEMEARRDKLKSLGDFSRCSFERRSHLRSDRSPLQVATIDKTTHNIANLCIGWVPLKMNVPLLIDEPDISCFARTIMHPIGIGFVMAQALWKREHAPMDDTAVGQNLIGFLCMPHEWDQAQGNRYRAPSLAHGPVVHADLNGLALSIV